MRAAERIERQSADAQSTSAPDAKAHAGENDQTETNGRRTYGKVSDTGRGYRPANGFTRFFKEEWPSLRQHLRRFVSAPDADEIAQEAFVRVWSDGDVKQSAGGYLYRTARNLVVDDQRRRKRLHDAPVETVLETYADPRPSPEDEVHWRMRLERARAVFDRMSPKCQKVFLLRVFDGYSYAEISEKTGMSERAVERHVLRAFTICAEWQEKEDGDKRRRRGSR